MPHGLDIIYIVYCCIVFQKKFDNLAERLDRHDYHVALLIVQQLDQLWVQMLVALLGRQILPDERQLATNFFAHLPVEVLADVGHDWQKVLLERLYTQQ